MPDVMLHTMMGHVHLTHPTCAPGKPHRVGHNVGQGLCVSGRARAAAVDGVSELGQLVGDPVHDVRAATGSGCCDIACRARADPEEVRESAPITTPPSYSTAMMVVCHQRPFMTNK